MIPPILPPLPDTSSLSDSSNSPFGTRSFRFKIVIAFVLLFGFYVWGNLFVKDSVNKAARNDRAKLYVDVLTDTKQAYAYRDYEERYGESNSLSNSRRLEQNQVRDVVKSWRKLAESPRASAGDWRRLGIVQHAFGNAVDGAKSLDKAAELSTTPRTKKERDDFETPPYLPAAKSAETERKFWHAIYDVADKKLPQPTPIQAATLRSELAKYRLGWFEHLAARQISLGVNDPLNAAAEKSAALESCHRINLVNNLRVLLILWGFAALIWYAIKALVKKIKRKGLRSDVMEIPSLPVLPNAFSYRARVIAFLTYLVIPIMLIIPLMLVRRLIGAASAVNLMRMQTILYLISAFAMVALALWVLDRLPGREGESAGVHRDKSVLQRLGFWSKEPGGEVLRGIHGYGMAMVVMLVAGGISWVLFSRFKTPSHPIVYELLVMQTFSDRVLMFLQVAVAAAITEEIMFRGVLYPAFRERFGVVGGITITSALFALAHPTLPGGFLPLMALGAAFNIAYEKRGSLLPCITMHALNNGLLILAEFAVMAS